MAESLSFPNQSIDECLPDLSKPVSGPWQGEHDTLRHLEDPPGKTEFEDRKVWVFEGNFKISNLITTQAGLKLGEEILWWSA